MHWPVTFALLNSLAMIAAGVFVLFFHDRRHQDIESWVDFSFSAGTLRRVLGYYRTMAALMGVFFVLFVVSLILLQRVAGLTLFAEGKAFYVSIFFFALDLVARGAFFDWMEHFEISITPVSMNRDLFWLVVYAFIFRMFFALTLLKILISFAWIWGKVRRARRETALEALP